MKQYALNTQPGNKWVMIFDDHTKDVWLLREDDMPHAIFVRHKAIAGGWRTAYFREKSHLPFHECSKCEARRFMRENNFSKALAQYDSGRWP